MSIVPSGEGCVTDADSRSPGARARAVLSYSEHPSDAGDKEYAPLRSLLCLEWEADVSEKSLSLLLCLCSGHEGDRKAEYVLDVFV